MTIKEAKKFLEKNHMIVVEKPRKGWVIPVYEEIEEYLFETGFAAPIADKRLVIAEVRSVIRKGILEAYGVDKFESIPTRKLGSAITSGIQIGRNYIDEHLMKWVEEGHGVIYKRSNIGFYQ